jgi:K+-sensing histidine kinase KdpD
MLTCARAAAWNLHLCCSACAGLGLPLAKQIVELQGGRLELASDINVGTRVTLVFSAARIAALERIAWEVARVFALC